MQAPQRKCVNGAAKAVRVCVDVGGGVVVCVCVFLHVAEQTEARPALDVRGHLALTARTGVAWSTLGPGWLVHQNIVCKPRQQAYQIKRQLYRRVHHST